MERLTKRNKGWIDIDPKNNGEGTVERCIQRLAAYEDTGMEPERVAELAEAERDGRLVELPFPHGTKIYRISTFGNGIIKEEVYRFNLHRDSLCSIETLTDGTNSNGAHIKLDLQNLGRKFFLTRAEAEAALQRQKEGAE